MYFYFPSVRLAEARQVQLQLQVLAKKAPTSKLNIEHLEPLNVVKVKTDYTAQSPTELSIIVDEVLAIYQQIDSGWWYVVDWCGHLPVGGPLLDGVVSE